MEGLSNASEKVSGKLRDLSSLLYLIFGTTGWVFVEMLHVFKLKKKIFKSEAKKKKE